MGVTRVKRRSFAGAVCLQEVYSVSDRAASIKTAEPRIRFKDEEEREKHKLEISRRTHAMNFAANFSPTSIYSTLTFDDEHEVHTFREARRIRDNYVRRLMRKYPSAVIFIYMGRGKNTSRIHFHMVSEGIPEEDIVGKWDQGEIVHIRNLREHNYYKGVDHGRDYTGLANYLFNHWTQEQGGHRWKQTRTAQKPDREPAKEIKRTYSEDKPPRAPKGYILVETKATRYGYLCFKYVKQPPKRTRRKKAPPRTDPERSV